MSPRDELRARAKALGIKNVSKYTMHELSELVEAEEKAYVEAAVSEAEAPTTLQPNRREMRANGLRFGRYRMPREQAKRTGSASHWLSRAIAERPSKSEYLKAKREASA